MGLWKNVGGELKGLKRLWGCFASEKKGKNHKESKENNHKEREEENPKEREEKT